MKRIPILLAISLFCIVSWTEKSKNYAIIEGKIINANSDSLVVYWEEVADTTVKPWKPSLRWQRVNLNADGTFKDTLKNIGYNVGQTLYYDDNTDKRAAQLYLNNGYELVVNADVKNWDETLTFGGKNAGDTEYLNDYFKLMSTFAEGKYKGMFTGSKEFFEEKLEEIVIDLDAFLEGYKQKLSPAHYAKEKTDLASKLKKDYRAYFAVKSKAAGSDEFASKPSPKFENYETPDGNKMSLDDFKGKYVYIDVWATWCGPCIAEIPSLKKLEEEYHGKNIEFVSISIDAEKAKEKWKKMVIDKELKGIQLRADKDFSSSFIVNYKITGIPRFILIDPSGNVVSSDAPRPSQYEEIKKLFDSVLK